MVYEWRVNKPSFIYVLSTHAGYYFIMFLVIYTVYKKEKRFHYAQEVVAIWHLNSKDGL